MSSGGRPLPPAPVLIEPGPQNHVLAAVECGVDEFLLSGFNPPDGTAAGDAGVPAAVTLLQNSPNPFNPKTEIRFGLPAGQTVDLKVYDASGRLVATLLRGRHLDAGFHTVDWSGINEKGRPVSSGIYFTRLDTETGSLSSKMTLIK